MRILDDITGAIGGTPLVRLSRLAAGLPGDVVVKHEALNPGGSLKDRIALHMIDDALSRGELRPGMVVVEPTSGNTGIGLAQAAVVRGVGCVIVMPESASVERRQVLAALGATVVLSPAADGIPGAISAADEVAARLGEPAWMPRQTDNPANPEAHYRSTGPEIWRDTDGTVDVLVAGVGTGGTITGTARYLREQAPSLRVVAVQPAASPLLTGGVSGPHLQTGLSGGFLAPVLDTTVYDEVVDVADDLAYATTRPGAAGGAPRRGVLGRCRRRGAAGRITGRLRRKARRGSAFRLGRALPVHAAVHGRGCAVGRRPRRPARLRRQRRPPRSPPDHPRDRVRSSTAGNGGG